MAYSLVVVNNGPSDAANLSVTDTLPAGVTFVSASGAGWTCTNVGNVSVTCTRPTLATGATAPTITVTVTAPAQAAALTNTATVTSATADPNAANNTSTAITTVTASADLAITKSGPATVVAAGSVSYSLVVVNNGPSDAANLSVADTLPAGVTFVSASGAGWACSNVGNVSATCTRAALAAGATAPTITIVVTAPTQAGSLSNTASVASTTADPVPANNTSTVVTTVTASADLAMTKLGPPTVTAGGSVAYSLVVVNNGPVGRGEPVGRGHPAGRGDVRVGVGGGVGVLERGERVRDVHPAGPCRGGDGADDHGGGDRPGAGDHLDQHGERGQHDGGSGAGEQHFVGDDRGDGFG